MAEWNPSCFSLTHTPEHALCSFSILYSFILSHAHANIQSMTQPQCCVCFPRTVIIEVTGQIRRSQDKPGKPFCGFASQMLRRIRMLLLFHLFLNLCSIQKVIILFQFFRCSELNNLTCTQKQLKILKRLMKKNHSFLLKKQRYIEIVHRVNVHISWVRQFGRLNA